MTFLELSHYSLFPGLFVAFTYNKKEPPAFGAAPAFWCILLPFLGLSFRHITENLSPPNVSTAEAPFFYQISGTWSNHEGSILSWCRIPSFYGFLLCYRGRPQSHNVSKRRGHRERIDCSFVSNFLKNSIRYLQQKSGKNQLYTPFVRRTLVDSDPLIPGSRRNQTFDGPALRLSPQLPNGILFYAPLDQSLRRKMSFAPLGAQIYQREGYEVGYEVGKRTHPQRLPPVVLPGPSDVRTSSINEQRIDGALGIALFFSLFLSASSDPFVRNFFVRTEPLAESNPVLQDPILSIHPPCIYAGEVASAMGFGLCRSKILNGIVALHSPVLYKDATEKNGRQLRSAGCVGSQRIRSRSCGRSSLFTHPVIIEVGEKCAPARWLPFHRSLLMLLRRRFFAFDYRLTYRPGMLRLSPHSPYQSSLLLSSHLRLSPHSPYQSSLRLSSLRLSSQLPSRYASVIPHSPYQSSLRLTSQLRLSSFLPNTSTIVSPLPVGRPSHFRLTSHLRLSPHLPRSAYLSVAYLTVSFSSLETGWTGAQRDKWREQAKRVVLPSTSNGTDKASTSPLCWTAGANTVVSDQDQEPIRIWILTCRLFLTVGISPGSWWAHHELGRGGWWFRDPVENASFMPRVSATACIHSVILPLLHSWTSLLNIVTLPCCVLGTFSIRSGLLAPVHSSATDDTRGRFLWWFFLLITGISMILFPQMKQQASVRRTHKKEMEEVLLLLCTYFLSFFLIPLLRILRVSSTFLLRVSTT
uniref:CcmFN n=1 Tax=Zostera marina TaxID=29655 RepID=A0A1Z1V6J8_ZOSMR|nr:CcmFN [Zostera marina]ARX63720.1 CcmFN [Zostera marina]WMB97346.1 cytochrome c biogenesis FN [Zostera marina]WMB97370.1 cytochrome c biogenesis FN [Zostera marina]